MNKGSHTNLLHLCIHVLEPGHRWAREMFTSAVWIQNGQVRTVPRSMFTLRVSFLPIDSKMGRCDCISVQRCACVSFPVRVDACIVSPARRDPPYRVVRSKTSCLCSTRHFRITWGGARGFLATVGHNYSAVLERHSMSRDRLLCTCSAVYTWLGESTLCIFSLER